MAATLDGHVAHPTEVWNFGSAEDRRRMDRLREWADAVIVSRKTLEHDNMDLSVRTKPHSKRQPRPVIVMQSSRPLRANLRVLKHAHRGGELWLAAEHKNADLKSLWPDLTATWDIFFYNSVREITESLVSRGLNKLLLEGGPTLNGFFFSEDLVDEFFLTLLPMLWGGTTSDRAVMTGQPIPLQKFRLKSAEKRKDEMFLHYIRRQPLVGPRIRPVA